jgi:hypothetical protein
MSCFEGSQAVPTSPSGRDTFGIRIKGYEMKKSKED